MASDLVPLWCMPQEMGSIGVQELSCSLLLRHPMVLLCLYAMCTSVASCTVISRLHWLPFVFVYASMQGVVCLTRVLPACTLLG